MFMHATPCKLLMEMLMDFLVLFDAYPIDASISGAFDASGANIKLTKNDSIFVNTPNLPKTSTIGSENIKTINVPQNIIYSDL